MAQTCIFGHLVDNMNVYITYNYGITFLSLLFQFSPCFEVHTIMSKGVTLPIHDPVHWPPTCLSPRV